jgi:dTDP-4-amino-4,6-dideoxygalactose transaminase
VIANDPAVFARMQLLHDHGRNEQGDIVSWGLNSRLDNLQAAILDSRLKRYEAVMERRRELARIYHQRLATLPWLHLPPAPGQHPDHFDIFQNFEIEAERRDALREFLKRCGIGTLLPWGGKAVHQWEQLGLEVRLPYTEALFERLLLLPMNLSLSDDQVHVVCDTIQEFYRS